MGRDMFLPLATNVAIIAFLMLPLWMILVGLRIALSETHAMKEYLETGLFFYFMYLVPAAIAGVFYQIMVSIVAAKVRKWGLKLVIIVLLPLIPIFVIALGERAKLLLEALPSIVTVLMFYGVIFIRLRERLLIRLHK